MTDLNKDVLVVDDIMELADIENRIFQMKLSGLLDNDYNRLYIVIKDIDYVLLVDAVNSEIIQIVTRYFFDRFKIKVVWANPQTYVESGMMLDG